MKGFEIFICCCMDVRSWLLFWSTDYTDYTEDCVFLLNDIWIICPLTSIHNDTFSKYWLSENLFALQHLFDFTDVDDNYCAIIIDSLNLALPWHWFPLQMGANASVQNPMTCWGYFNLPDCLLQLNLQAGLCNQWNPWTKDCKGCGGFPGDPGTVSKAVS